MPENRYTRRRVLGTAAGVAGAAAGFGLLPGSVRQALADARPAGGFDAIEHVVLLMQENRSFDHYFGTMPGVRGFSDPEALRLSTGKSVFYQPDAVNPDGYTLPFHLDTKTTSAQAIPSTSHAWAVQHQAWNNGAMDQWLPAHRAADGVNGPYVMGYYEREDIPFQFALADAFTVCDNSFSSVLGPTWPNRLYWMTGTIDPDGLHGGPITVELVPERRAYTWTTYAERLQAAGISWRVYQEQDNYGCNLLENFASSRARGPETRCTTTGWPAGRRRLRGRRAQRRPAAGLLDHPGLDPVRAPGLPAGGRRRLRREQDRGDRGEPEGVGEDRVRPLLRRERRPVRPRAAAHPAPGTADEFVGGLPVGGGFRVPTILISPWTAGGWVCTERFDHTSSLRLLERLTGVEETNISDWRRRTFGDFTSAFRFDSANLGFPSLPDTARLLAEAEQEVADNPAPPLPGANQTPPEQQWGWKPTI